MNRQRVLIFLLTAVLAATGSRAAEPKADAAASPPSPQVAYETPADEIGLRISPLTADDLAAEAAAWQAALKAKTQEIVALRLALRQAQGEDAARVNERLLQVAAERNALSAGLGAILAAWEAKGGAVEKVDPIRRYVNVTAAEQIKETHATTAWAALVKWLTSKDGGLAFLLQAASVVVGALLIWAGAGIVSRIVRRAVARVPNVSDLLRRFLARLAFWAVVVAGAMVLLATLGVHVGGLLAIVGGASFVIAFAMQSTLSNFAAGLMIMIYRPFDVGDYVEVAGVSGTVKDVSLVSTTVTTPDNRIIVIPNGNVWGSVITNATGSDTRRVDLAFTIGREEDAARAQRIMEEVLAQHPLVLADPAPVVRIQEFGDASVRFGCEAWTRTADYWRVYWDIVKGVKERLDAARPVAAVAALEHPAAA
jgi:small conductance mechanosensitive channel